jgi:hypothetical protein
LVAIIAGGILPGTRIYRNAPKNLILAAMVRQYDGIPPGAPPAGTKAIRSRLILIEPSPSSLSALDQLGGKVMPSTGAVLCPVEAGTGEKPIEPGMHAVAVELDFVQPA